MVYYWGKTPLNISILWYFNFRHSLINMDNGEAEVDELIKMHSLVLKLLMMRR